MLMRAPIVLSALVSIMLAPVSSVQAQPRSSAEITRILDIYLRGCIDKADGSLRVYIPRLVLAGVSPRDDVLARQCDLRREVEVIFRPARDGEDGSSALGPGHTGACRASRTAGDHWVSRRTGTHRCRRGAGLGGDVNSTRALIGGLFGLAAIALPVVEAQGQTVITSTQMKGCISRADGTLRVFSIFPGREITARPCDPATEIEVVFRSTRDGRYGTDASGVVGPPGRRGLLDRPDQMGEQGPEGPTGPQGPPG
jgi:hypothetical protein